MAAVVNKNEAIAQARSVEINVFASDGTLAPPETDLTGFVFISQSTYKLIPATGSTINKRHTLVIADDVIESVDTGADEVTLTAHGYRHLDGPIISDETIGSIAIGNDVFIIYVDENTVAFASSLDNAASGVREALTGTETGATLSDYAETERAIPGKWQHTFTQAETNVNACELNVQIIGHPTYEGGASVNLERGGASLLDQELEDGHTVGDAMRAQFRGEIAPYELDGNEHIIMSIDGTKESHRATVTDSGRSGTVITDLSP